MTAIALDRPRTVERTADRPIPLTRVVRVELRKMFDTRAGFWLMASIAILSVVATGAVILFAPDDELTFTTFGTAIGFPMAVILPMVAVLSVTSEWSQRSGLSTFTLVPHRGRVILAKGIAVVGVGVVSMVLAFAIGALGNVVGTAITGTPLVWDVSALDVGYIVLGNVLGMLIAFALGLLLRSSPAAITAYLVLNFVATALTELLAANATWFRDARGWVDPNYAQAPLFSFSHTLTGQEWEHLGVTMLIWLVVPLLAGLRLVMRSEVK
jgi:ABC-2 type transport system permease protein